MNRTKYLKGECQHCSGSLEFQAEHIGMTVPCPHCGEETELLLPQPPEEPSVPTRAIVWTVIAVIVLGLGLGGSLIALKRAQNWAANQKRQAAASAPAMTPSTNSASDSSETNSPAADSLQASAVVFEHAPGTSLVYATGTIKNSSGRQRFGIKIELELSDGGGQKVGTATDYRSVMEPGAEWHFKALVVDAKAQSAKVVAIREDQ